ncbi:MAG: hypothetical protein M1454_00835 [Candidatus Thermoplasmatota archaeon]|nr:hypothetical protein [Candidatus Thermoplasmatota archaeon]MCL5730845.1 hypothetical protein [Candidatus Thermoplasmatota archaeon]
MEREASVINRNGDEMLISLRGLVNLYEKVFDGRKRPIGKIVRILGPVSSPMAVLKLFDPKNTENNIQSVYLR